MNIEEKNKSKKKDFIYKDWEVKLRKNVGWGDYEFKTLGSAGIGNLCCALIRFFYTERKKE